MQQQQDFLFQNKRISNFSPLLLPPSSHPDGGKDTAPVKTSRKDLQMRALCCRNHGGCDEVSEKIGVIEMLKQLKRKIFQFLNKLFDFSVKHEEKTKKQEKLEK